MNQEAMKQRQLEYEKKMNETIMPHEFGEDCWDLINPLCCGEPFYRHKKNHSIYKDKETGQAIYNSAIYWTDSDNKYGYTGIVDGIGTSHFIDTSKPFTPKTFHIEAIVEIYDDGDFTFTQIKDRTQLDEVFKYYVKKEVSK